jgi:hypothetical protein
MSVYGAGFWCGSTNWGPPGQLFWWWIGNIILLYCWLVDGLQLKGGKQVGRCFLKAGEEWCFWWFSVTRFYCTQERKNSSEGSTFVFLSSCMAVCVPCIRCILCINNRIIANFLSQMLIECTLQTLQLSQTWCFDAAMVLIAVFYSMPFQHENQVSVATWGQK